MMETVCTFGKFVITKDEKRIYVYYGNPFYTHYIFSFRLWF